MADNKYNGYFLQLRVLRNLETNTWDTVFVLRDDNKLVGIFDDDTFANRYWNKYVASRRTEVKENNTYDMEAKYEAFT